MSTITCPCGCSVDVGSVEFGGGDWVSICECPCGAYEVLGGPSGLLSARSKAPWLHWPITAPYPYEDYWIGKRTAVKPYWIIDLASVDGVDTWKTGRPWWGVVPPATGWTGE